MSNCLTWYCTTDGLIRIRSVMLWNDIGCTSQPTLMHESHHWVNAEMLWCDRENAVMSIGVKASKSGITCPRRWLYSDRIVPAMRRQAQTSIHRQQPDTPKTIFEYYLLSYLFNLHDYFTTTFLWLGAICLDSSWHNLNTHIRRGSTSWGIWSSC